MKAVILAAGIGSRLANSIPKPLTKLNNGETILGRQVKFLNKYIPKEDIIIVVGYKKQLIINKFSNNTIICNDLYEQTNTSKSLLLALENIYNEDVIWLNGDVVFNKAILEPIISFKKSCMLVNTKSVKEEEIKYTIDTNGHINQVSKIVSDGIGEAIGINKISKLYLEDFKKALEKCKKNDYFEYALEIMINNSFRLFPIDISNYFCIEIDFKSDLECANKNLRDI